MTTITTTGTLIDDESATNQNDDVDFSALSSGFQTYLTNAGLTTGIIEEAKGLTIAVAPEGSTVTNLFFSDASGNALPTSGTGLQVFDTLHPDGLGGYLPLQTKDGENIYLFGDSTEPDIAIAKDASGDLVAIFYLNDPTNLSASVEMVLYQALYNQDPTKADADYVNWGDVLSVSASGSLEFNFNNLDSGQFTWVAVGTSDAGMIVTGSRLNIAADGTRGGSGKTASDSMNTSQGGDGATIGVDNQMFTPGDSAIFTLVRGFEQLPATAGDATGQDIDDIVHDGYLDTNSAELFVSQRQGNALLDISLSIFTAGSNGDDEDADGGAAGPYADRGAVFIGNGKNQTVGRSADFTDDTPVDIVSVEIKQGSTTVGVWTTDAVAAGASSTDNIYLSGSAVPNGQAFAGIKVTITGNDALVENVDAGYSIKVNSGAETYNRIELGSETGAFDIGKFVIDTPAGDTDVIGDNIQSDDDGPGFSAQIVSVTVDQGTTTPETHSLNGLPGLDTNAHYTIDKYEDVAGFVEEETLDTDGNVVGVSYYVDTNPDPVAETKGALAFTLSLDDAANSGAGSYTFTNFLPAPAGNLEFDFTFFPSGSSMFGILLDNDEQSDLTPETGLLVIGQNVVLDGNGSMVSGTNTINTSAGGGPVTIGVNNQMFDPGEGAVFVYLTDPNRNSTATQSKADGLTQNTADDADALGFGGTLEAQGGSIEIVQRQGSDQLGMILTAYDLSDDDEIVAATDPLGGKTKKISSDDVSQEARDWVNNGSGDVLSSGSVVKINSITVYDTGSSTPKAEFTIDTTTGVVTGGGAGITVVADQDHDGDYDGDDFITILGFQDHDTIAWTTDGDHDAVLVEGFSGAWDVGGFNIEQASESPDIDLSFSVAITDKDGDSYRGLDSTIDDFKIKLDGNGQYDDPNNVAPSTFSTSYDFL